MRRRGLVASVLFLAAAGAAAQPEEPFRPKGTYDNSIYRFHPDLDTRFNAVRYGRWRALQIAWTSGIDPRLDREFSAYLLALLADPPRLAPEADRVAPALAREAVPVFRALRWGQTLEQQFLDILASADSSPSLSRERAERALRLYRRERYALSEPAEPASPSQLLDLAPVSARILISGTRLFVVAAADFATSDFAQQRWKVKTTIEDFDRSYSAERGPRESWYEISAPAAVSAYPAMTEALDCVARFRAEVFEALIPGGATREARQRRDERLRAVARRYGLPVEGIGGR